MRIRHIPASELLEFAEKAGSYYDGNIPITPWRAESQIKNPFTNPDDVLLVVAEDENKLLGYIGILPGKAGRINTPRLFWNSCWWVAEGAGAAVSLFLLNEFMKITNKQVAFSDLTEKSKTIIEKLGFEISERRGILLRIRSGLHQRIKIRKKSGLFSGLLVLLSLSGIFKLMDFILNSKGSLLKNFSDITENIDVQKLWIPDKECFSFIQEVAKDNITQPDEAYFKWWLTSRWLAKDTKESRAISERYYFSSLASIFELFLVKVRSGEEIIGLALLGNREGVIKTHYLWCREEDALSFYNGLAQQIVEGNKVHSIISFHEGFAEYLKDKFGFKTGSKELKRYTAISSVIKSSQAEYHFQDGDGDYIFT